MNSRSRPGRSSHPQVASSSKSNCLAASSASAAPRRAGRALELLADARTTATWNVVLTREAAWVIPACAADTGAALGAMGAAEFWGRFCFIDEAPFAAANASPWGCVGAGRRPGDLPIRACCAGFVGRCTLNCYSLPPDGPTDRTRPTVVECEAVAVRQVADGLGEPLEPWT